MKSGWKMYRYSHISPCSHDTDSLSAVLQWIYAACRIGVVSHESLGIPLSLKPSTQHVHTFIHIKDIRKENWAGFEYVNVHFLMSYFRVQINVYCYVLYYRKTKSENPIDDTDLNYLVLMNQKTKLRMWCFVHSLCIHISLFSCWHYSRVPLHFLHPIHTSTCRLLKFTMSQRQNRVLIKTGGLV